MLVVGAEILCRFFFPPCLIRLPTIGIISKNTTESESTVIQYL
jgi:hypothetical protein